VVFLNNGYATSPVCCGAEAALSGAGIPGAHVMVKRGIRKRRAAAFAELAASLGYHADLARTGGEAPRTTR